MAKLRFVNPPKIERVDRIRLKARVWRALALIGWGAALALYFKV